MSGLRRITGSGVARLQKCDAAGVLPGSDADNPFASYGTAGHGFLSTVSSQGVEAAIEQVDPKYREAMAQVDLSRLPACEPDAYASEVGFAYDPDSDTAVELGRGLSHDDMALLMEGRPPREMSGVSDVIGLTAEAVIVGDYKFGRTDYGPLAAMQQMLFYAVAAARAYERDSAVLQLVRIFEDGTSYTEVAEISAMELDAAAQRLLELANRVEANQHLYAAGEHVEPFEGDHCAYCPSFKFCPAKTTLASALAAPGQWRELVVGEQGLTVETAQVAYEKLKLAEAMLKKLRESLKEFANITAIPIGDGWVFGRKEDHPDTKIIPAEAVPVLREIYGDDVAEFAAAEVDHKLSLEGLKRALRVFVNRTPGGKIGKVYDSALELLVERNAARITKKAGVREHKPEPREEPPPVVPAVPEVPALPSGQQVLEEMKAQGEAEYLERTAKETAG